jgi:rhamnose transport system permease protein
VATGSNAGAARIAAIDVAAVRLAVFVAAGTLTGLAAVVNAVRFNQIPSNTGLGLEMKVIAAVVVGGVAVTGGRGSLAGAMLGVVLLGMSGPALTFLGASPYWERALQGSILLAAVALNAAKSTDPWARQLQGTRRELA